MSVLFLLLASLAIIVGAYVQTHKTKKALDAKSAHENLPKAVSMFIIAAQISELGTLVEHATTLNVIATLMVFTIILAISAGTAESFDHRH